MSGEKTPSVKPEDIIEMWREMEKHAPTPKASDDQILGIVEPSLPDDYAFRDHLPKFEAVPRYPEWLQPMIPAITDNIRTTFQSLADAIGGSCGVEPVDLKGWQGAIRQRNLLSVLFHPGGFESSQNAQRLLLAPLQVTVGPVMVLAVRGYIPFVSLASGSGSVKFFDLRHLRKVAETTEGHYVNTKVPGGKTSEIAKMADRILTDLRIIRPGEVK